MISQLFSVRKRRHDANNATKGDMNFYRTKIQIKEDRDELRSEERRKKRIKGQFNEER